MLTHTLNPNAFVAQLVVSSEGPGRFGPVVHERALEFIACRANLDDSNAFADQLAPALAHALNGSLISLCQNEALSRGDRRFLAYRIEIESHNAPPMDLLRETARLTWRELGFPPQSSALLIAHESTRSLHRDQEPAQRFDWVLDDQSSPAPRSRQRLHAREWRMSAREDAIEQGLKMLQSRLISQGVRPGVAPARVKPRL